MADQTIESRVATLWSDSPIRAVRGEDGIGQRCWSRGHGRFTAEYKAIVAVKRERVQLELYPATPPRMLDGELTPYLMPSRYCPSDRFEGFVAREFGGLEGGPLAAALTEWVYQSLDYRCGSSSGETTALDTFASRSGVCRDYSHLLVSLARAGGIPARCVVGLCAGRRSARLPCGRGAVAGRRLAADRCDEDGDVQRYRAGLRRARCDRYRVHDGVRAGVSVGADGEGDAARLSRFTGACGNKAHFDRWSSPRFKKGRRNDRHRQERAG